MDHTCRAKARPGPLRTRRAPSPQHKQAVPTKLPGSRVESDILLLSVKINVLWWWWGAVPSLPSGKRAWPDLSFPLLSLFPILSSWKSKSNTVHGRNCNSVLLNASFLYSYVFLLLMFQSRKNYVRMVNQSGLWGHTLLVI